MLFATFAMLQSCIPEAQNKSLTYQNITILADLSDRIEPTINGRTPNQQYPPKDMEEIDKILKFFKNECVKPGEKIGDRSCISFSTFSSEPIAYIDISKDKDVGATQEYVNSTGEFLNKGLDYEIDIFKQKVHNAYATIRNDGVDLISITIEILENKPIIKENVILTNGIDTTFVNYDNHVYIFTDGYLEYKGKNANGQFYFGNIEIDKVRKYCLEQDVDINTALKNLSSLCLPPVKNEKNHMINLHILETHERDKDSKFQKYNNDFGVRDNEILEAVWSKWAKDSGFKSFEWKKY